MGIELNDRSSRLASRLAFVGKWTPNIISQYMWPRFKCHARESTRAEDDLTPFSTQSTTTIYDLEFENVGKSLILKQLQEGARAGKLSVRITMLYHS